MMWDGMDGIGGAAWLWMAVWWVFVLALLVLTVLAAMWLTRGLSGDRSRRGPGEPGASESAREALDLRYARGELSRDEYRQARRDLDNPVAGEPPETARGGS